MNFSLFIVLIALASGCKHLKDNHLLKNIIRRLGRLEKATKTNGQGFSHLKDNHLLNKITRRLGRLEKAQRKNVQALSNGYSHLKDNHLLNKITRRLGRLEKAQRKNAHALANGYSHLKDNHLIKKITRRLGRLEKAQRKNEQALSNGYRHLKDSHLIRKITRRLGRLEKAQRKNAQGRKDAQGRKKLPVLPKGYRHLKDNRLLNKITRRLERLEKAQRKFAQASIATGRKKRSTPAFSAYVGKDTSFQAGETYIFDRVILNVYRMYNKDTGKAVIPSNGNYVITWHVLANGGYWDYPYLMVNGVIKGTAGCHSGVGSVRSSCGNSLVFPLKRGDKIWIEEVKFNKRRTNVQGGFSSFAVYKL